MKCHQAETSDGPAEHFPRSRDELTRSVEGEVEERRMWKKDEEEVSRAGLTRSVEEKGERQQKQELKSSNPEHIVLHVVQISLKNQYIRIR